MHNEDQLRSYLAWAIHGRKPQRRATSPTRKGPPRDKTYLAWIREMPCIACGVEGRSVAAHTGTDGGMSQKASDYSCVPLCADRSEEHTSELQSLRHLVCRLLLEKNYSTRGSRRTC